MSFIMAPQQVRRERPPPIRRLTAEQWRNGVRTVNGRAPQAVGESAEAWEKRMGIVRPKVWRAARYLMKGRPYWDNFWVDTSEHEDPHAYLRERLGPPLEAFEFIPGIEGLTMRQVIIDEEVFYIQLPQKRRTRRSTAAPTLQ